MADEYINFNSLIGQTSCQNEEPTKSDKIYRLYQLQCIKDTSGVVVKHVGNSKIDSPTDVQIHDDFNFDNYKCSVVSHLFNEHSIKTLKCFNLISLYIKQDNEIKGMIVLQYSTNELNLGNNEKGDLNIYFVIGERKILMEKLVYPGDNNIIYTLIEFLTHDSVSWIY